MDLVWPFALAGFAGFVNYIQRFAGPDRPAWEWMPCAIKVFTGAFVGYLAMQAIGKRIEDTGYVNVAIALAGYGGPLTLDFAFQLGKDAVSAFVARKTAETSGRDPKN